MVNPSAVVRCTLNELVLTILSQIQRTNSGPPMICCANASYLGGRSAVDTQQVADAIRVAAYQISSAHQAILPASAGTGQLTWISSLTCPSSRRGNISALHGVT